MVANYYWKKNRWKTSFRNFDHVGEKKLSRFLHVFFYSFHIIFAELLLVLDTERKSKDISKIQCFVRVIPKANKTFRIFLIDLRKNVSKTFSYLLHMIVRY